MMELRRSNDLVYLSWARVVLLDAGIEIVLLDDNVSSVEGSIGAIPRRLMVLAEDLVRARGVLSRAEAEVAAGPAAERAGGGVRPVPTATGLTEDTLLDGRVALAQPAAGYRVAIDPVLLAAAVPARPGERVLDAGTGTGAAALCLAVRVPACPVVGIELDPELWRIAHRNVGRNRLEARVEVLPLDLADAPVRLGEGGFDHVMTNPPYLQAGAATPPPDPGRAAAHVEGARGLAGWLGDCLRLLRPRGRLTVIHRADRLDALLGLLSGPAGDLVVFPLWPTERAPAAKRVIVQARKGARGPMRLARGLVLHYLDGGYTEAAEAVLRRGEALAL